MILIGLLVLYFYMEQIAPQNNIETGDKKVPSLDNDALMIIVFILIGYQVYWSSAKLFSLLAFGI